MGGNKLETHVNVQTIQLMLRFQSDGIWLRADFSVGHHEDEGRETYAKSSYLFTNPRGLISRHLEYLSASLRESQDSHTYSSGWGWVGASTALRIRFPQKAENFPAR